MYTEKSPLTASQPAYTYHDPTRQYKKQVKQFQCLLCVTVIALIVTAMITALMLSADDDDYMDTIFNTNGSSPMLEGKLSASQGDAVTHGPSGNFLGDSMPKPIKLYTSGIVVNGMATGGLDGEEAVQVFDGSLPVTIPLDDIIDPTAYSPTAPITWSGVVKNNNTITGKFSVPVKVKNGTSTSIVDYKGTFQVELAFKWSNNLDIVIPNKVYQCKMIFQAAFGASLGNNPADIAKNTVKGKDDLTKETCAVLLQGSFYEKSLICYLTPWWCTDQKLFYWNGGVEFKIVKPPMRPNSPPPAVHVENSGATVLNSALKSGSEEGVQSFGYKILGKVANGWVTTQDETGTKTIWNGELPTNISAGMFPSNDMDSGTITIGRNIKWSCSVFSTSLRGTFSLPMTNRLGMSKTIKGSFFFLLESDPSVTLNSALGSGIEYTSSLQFKDSPQVFNGTQIIDFPWHNVSMASSYVEYLTPVLLLGKVNKVTKSIVWDGTFEMIVKKIPQNENNQPGPVSSLSSDNNGNENNTTEKPLLGSEAPWSSNLTAVGSKLTGKVVSGWITLQDNSGIKTIWGGDLPAQISLPMFFNPTTDMSDLSDEYGHGITWSCTVYQSSLRGTFQLPQYTKFGLVKWLKGSFFFQLDSDPTWALTDALHSGMNYSSPLHFRVSTDSYNGSQLTKFYSHDSTEIPNNLGIKAPVILLGESSKVSGIFTWNGRFEIIIKRSKLTASASDDNATNSPPLNQPVLNLGKSPSKGALAVPDPNAVGSKLLGKVKSGWVTMTDSYGTHTIWNGALPVKVSAPMFYNPTTDMSDLTDEYGHGAVWSCSLFHSTLKGTYQLPQYTKFGLVKWIKGSFFFELESSPYWSLNKNVVPGINYYSPIHFRNAGEEATNVTKMITLYSDYQSSPMDDLGFKAPIILLGKTSKGKGTKSFTWDGRFVLIIKSFF